MRIIVQKFGGTSVSTPQGRELVVKKVVAAINNGFSPVVVVSAMGRKGDHYATDTLLEHARNANPSLAPRELDHILCCGEIISAVIMAGQLQVSNLNAMMMTGGQAGIITDDQYNNAQIISVDSSRLLEQLDQGKIPVVCGFQGKTATGDFTTLGRGGSDTTAAALGAALMAECIEIYTDVEGIMTADPRIVKTAKILDKISYSEVAQLANHGAKVIHPRAVELAAKKKIPLVVKSTFSDAPGTLIGDMTEKQLHQPQHTDRVATGVAHLPQITQIKITVDTAKTHQESAQIFRSLADGNISIDVINVHPGQVMFTVAEAVADRALANLKVQNYAAEAIYQCAKVSVVGGGICEVPGVMANFVEALSVHNIQILQTVDSHTSISALVKMSDMEMAVKALHQQFGLAE